MDTNGKKKNTKLKTPSLFKAKTQILFKKKKKNTHTRVTLNGQIMLYLYIVSRVAKSMRVACETFARKHKCHII